MAVVARSLGSEGFRQTTALTYGTDNSNSRLARSSNPADHQAHGCCLDPDPASGRGSYTILGWRRTVDPSTGELRRTGGAVAFSRRCESWSCFCCAVMLRRRAQRRVFKGAGMGGKVFMLTLTIDPRSPRWRAFRSEALGAEAVRLEGWQQRKASWAERWKIATTRASIRYVNASWNRMYTSIRKDPLFGSVKVVGADGTVSVPYVRAVELQKNGRAHLHVLLRAPSYAAGFGLLRRLRDLAVTSGFGGGMGFDMQAARSRADVARYVSKGARIEAYTVKAAELLPRRTRRFSYGASWCEWSPPTRVAGHWDWRLAGGSVSTVMRALERSGFVLEDPARLRVPAVKWGSSPGSV